MFIWILRADCVSSCGTQFQYGGMRKMEEALWFCWHRGAAQHHDLRLLVRNSVALVCLGPFLAFTLHLLISLNAKSATKRGRWCLYFDHQWLFFIY